MSRRPVCLILVCFLWLLPACSLYASSQLSPLSETPLLAAAPRWWDETIQWVRNLGWDRGRLVQLWLLFVCIGLYIILRIKPRA